MKKSPSKEVLKPMKNLDYCTSYILQKIESGQLVGGVRLGEPSLAKELGTDRATVRSAFERLSASGILERRARSGTYLKGMSLEDIRSANQVRCQLESLGAGLAAARATKAELEQLAKTARLVDELTESYVQGQIREWSSIRSLEIEFHTMVARTSGNPYLLSMLNRDSFLQVCFPFLVASKSLKLDRLRAHLRNAVGNMAVVKAIESGDSEKAQAVMTDHVRGSLDLYEKALAEEKDLS